MKKALLGSTLLFATLIPASFAEEKKDYYISIGGGGHFSRYIDTDSTLGGTAYNVDFNTESGVMFQGAIGKEFDEWRLEFNYGQGTVESDYLVVSSGGAGVSATMSPNLEIDVKTFLLYGIKDFKNDTKLEPYIGAGIGLGNLGVRKQTVTLAGTGYQVGMNSDSQTVLALAVKGGLSYEIAENTSLYSEAAYKNLAGFTYTEPGFQTVNYEPNHIFALTAGLKFKF